MYMQTRWYSENQDAHTSTIGAYTAWHPQKRLLNTRNMVTSKLLKSKRASVGAFFTLLILVGLLVYKDYGISWDEPIQRKYGEDVFNYVTGTNDKLLKNKDRYYGPTFELALVIGERALGLETFKEIYHYRHLVSYGFFVLGAYFLYLLASKILGDWKWGLLTSLFFVLSPRIFAHAFYNSKDIPFMCALIIAVYFMVRFAEDMSRKNALLLGITMALATTIRLMGIFSVPLLAIFSISKYKQNKETNYKELLKKPALVFGTYTLFIFLMWPTLWKSPLGNLKNAFEQMSQYPQSTSMYYYGTKVKSTEVPWHYTLGWLGATTPFVYVVLFTLGIAYFVIRFKKNPWANTHIFAVLGWFFIPPATVIALNSNLYDSWRQMFFIYPAFLIIALYGLKYFISSSPKWLGYLAGGLVVASLVLTSFRMVVGHPHQNVYFGLLAGNPNTIEERFELDYWGLSYKQAYDLIDKMDSRENIVVLPENYPGETNAFMSNNPGKFETTKHLHLADYYITNYRGSIDKTFRNQLSEENIINKGLTLVGVYRLR
jgi:hypothetical protein